MNTLLLKGNWDHLKGELKKKFGKLTDDDLTYVEGKEEELFGRIQKKLGLTREVLDLIIKEHAEHAKKKSAKHEVKK
jgi:uncharacterized protein YjbJ (UPF0337 family)